jgi:hypothetical protein
MAEHAYVYQLLLIAMIAGCSMDDGMVCLQHCNCFAFESALASYCIHAWTTCTLFVAMFVACLF